MDFFDLAKLMARWWFITVPMVVLTVLATAMLSDRIEPEFTARGSLILAAPNASAGAAFSDDDAAVTNPLLSLNGALPTTAYVTALSVGSPQVAAALAAEGYSTSYAVAAETRMPIILLETRAPTREMATNTALRLIDLVDNDLQLRQDAADVPEDERVRADVISVAVVGGADYGGRTRVRIAVLGLGLGATVGAVFLLEGLRQRRRQPRVEEAAVSPDPGVDDPDGADEATLASMDHADQVDLPPAQRSLAVERVDEADDDSPQENPPVPDWFDDGDRALRKGSSASV